MGDVSNLFCYYCVNGNGRFARMCGESRKGGLEPCVNSIKSAIRKAARTTSRSEEGEESCYHEEHTPPPPNTG